MSYSATIESASYMVIDVMWLPIEWRATRTSRGSISSKSFFSLWNSQESVFLLNLEISIFPKYPIIGSSTRPKKDWVEEFQKLSLHRLLNRSIESTIFWTYITLFFFSFKFSQVEFWSKIDQKNFFEALGSWDNLLNYFNNIFMFLHLEISNSIEFHKWCESFKASYLIVNLWKVLKKHCIRSILILKVKILIIKVTHGSILFLSRSHHYISYV